MVQLAIQYFDGTTARAHDATIEVDGESLVVREATSANELARLSVHRLQWPERTYAPTRILPLAAGEIHALDAAAWDAWVAQQARAGDSPIVRVQRSWRWVSGAIAFLVVGLIAGYKWGIPWVSGVLVSTLPASVDARIGEVALPQVDKLLLKPSALSAAQQRIWNERFVAMLKKAAIDPSGTALHFRGSRIGPNAFALPGGVIVITDELIDLAEQEQELAEPIVLGVLAHEYGHVKHRHSVKHLVSASMLSMATGALWGDYSGALALVPLIVGQAGYSRDAERQADEESVRLLHAAGISTLGMARFFVAVNEYVEKKAERDCLADRAQKSKAQNGQPVVDQKAMAACAAAHKKPDEPQLGIAITSHPSDHERIAFFTRAAGTSSIP